MVFSKLNSSGVCGHMCICVCACGFYSSEKGKDLGVKPKERKKKKLASRKAACFSSQKVADIGEIYPDEPATQTLHGNSVVLITHRKKPKAKIRVTYNPTCSVC